MRGRVKTMTHKERFLTAINHEEPDRVPIDVWYTPEAERKILKYLGEDTEKLSLYAADGGYLPHVMGHDFLITWLGPCTSYYSQETEEHSPISRICPGMRLRER
jgi:uroporphyrinogen decarboxylase